MLIFFGLVVWYFLGREVLGGGIWEGGLLWDMIDWGFGFFDSFVSVMRNVSVGGLAGCFCSLAYKHL